MSLAKFITLAAVFAFIAIFSIGANAQATRTYVSGVGDDANPCSRTAPCKTFAGAISKTAAGGEINVLDPGSYGGVTITKSLTINGAGTLASILVSGANGIIVNAGASDIVTIRNISFQGLNSGTNGINFIAGGQLNVENCDIRNFGTSGINMASAGALMVKDTTIFNTNTAVNLNAGVAASLDNVRLQGQAIGLNAVSSAVVSISNSVISHNTDAGIAAAITAQVNAESVKLTNNGTGIRAANNSIVRMSNLDIFNNTTGIARTESGVLASFSNNKIAGNGIAGAPTAYLANQ